MLTLGVLRWLAEPFAGLAFKIMTDPYVGQLTFIRVYSGVLKSGDTVINAVRERKERIGRLLQMHANKREEIEEVRAGDIAAAIGLRDTGTGDSHQLAVARQLATYRGKFPFDFVIMMGDNLYGGNGPKDYDKKFAAPYKPLIDAGAPGSDA